MEAKREGAEARRHEGVAALRFARALGMLALVGLFPALCACHSTEALPPPPGAPSTWILFVLGSETETAFVSTPEALPELSADRALELWALSYACPPESLGLSVGRVELGPIADRARLPPPASAFVGRSEGGEFSGWLEEEPNEEVDALIRRLPVSAETACSIYGTEFLVGSQTLIEIADSYDAATFLAPLDDHRVLSARDVGEVGIVDLDQGRWLPITSISTGTLVQDAVVRSDGEIWLVGARGVLLRGTSDGRFSEEAIRVAWGWPRLSMDGPRDAELPLDLFVASDQHVLGRFDGTTWTELLRSAPSSEDPVNPSVVWTGPETALAIGVSTDLRVVLRTRRGIIDELPLPQSDPGVVSGLADVPGYGVVALSRAANLYRVDGDELEKIGELEPFLGLGDFRTAPLPGGGFLLARAAEGTKFAQVHPLAGVCPTDFGVSARVTAMATIGAGVLVAQRNIRTQSMIMSYVRISRGPPPCAGR